MHARHAKEMKDLNDELKRCQDACVHLVIDRQLYVDGHTLETCNRCGKKLR
jgi:hypothetical protein